MCWESVLILHAHLLIFAPFSAAHFLSFLPSCPLSSLLPSYPPTFPSLSLSSLSYLPSLFANFSQPPLSPLFPYPAPPNCMAYLIPFSTSPPLPSPIFITRTPARTPTHTRNINSAEWRWVVFSFHWYREKASRAGWSRGTTSRASKNLLRATTFCSVSSVLLILNIFNVFYICCCLVFLDLTWLVLTWLFLILYFMCCSIFFLSFLLLLYFNYLVPVFRHLQCCVRACNPAKSKY